MEPINFEEELYKAFGQVKDFSLGMRIAKRFYDMGRKHQGPVSKDYEKALNSEAVAFLQSQQIVPNFYANMIIDAVKHGAKWQRQQDEHLIWQLSSSNYEKGKQEAREQIMKDAVNGVVDYPIIGCDFPNIYPDYRGLKDYCDRHKIKDDENVKLIIIKED